MSDRPKGWRPGPPARRGAPGARPAEEPSEDSEAEVVVPRAGGGSPAPTYTTAEDGPTQPTANRPRPAPDRPRLNIPSFAEMAQRVETFMQTRRPLISTDDPPLEAAPPLEHVHEDSWGGDTLVRVLLARQARSVEPWILGLVVALALMAGIGMSALVLAIVVVRSTP